MVLKKKKKERNGLKEVLQGEWGQKHYISKTKGSARALQMKFLLGNDT